MTVNYRQPVPSVSFLHRRDRARASGLTSPDRFRIRTVATAGWLEAHGPLEGHDAFFERHSYLQSKMALLLYYSRDRIMSWEAKRGFVEPDLAPFPRPAS